MSQGDEVGLQMEGFGFEAGKDPIEGCREGLRLMEDLLDGDTSKRMTVKTVTGMRKTIGVVRTYCEVMEKELQDLRKGVEVWKKVAEDKEKVVEEAVAKASAEVMKIAQKERGVLLGKVLEVQKERLREVNTSIEGNLAAWRDDGQRLRENLESLVKGLEEGVGSGCSKKEVPRLTGVDEEIRPMGVRVIITAEGQTVDEVKDRLKKMIRPEEIGVGVKSVVKTRKGLVVEVDDEEGRRKLEEKGVAKGLKVVKEEGERPMIVIRGVGKDVTDEDLREKVRKGNFKEKEKEEFDGLFKVVHRVKRRDGGAFAKDSFNVLVKCASEVRNKLVGQGRVFVGWEHLVVLDHIDVPRCFKCQVYGHVGKLCSREAMCGRCAGKHETERCREDKEVGKVCANCRREGRMADHDVGWWGCPAYKKAVARYLSRVDYGV